MEIDQYDHSSFVCGYAKIYTLADKNGNVFYVGATIQDLEMRLRMHIWETKNISSQYLSEKQLMIKELNYEVVATIVDKIYVTGTHFVNAIVKARHKEIEWINKFRSMGHKITNIQRRTKYKTENKKVEDVGFSVCSK